MDDVTAQVGPAADGFVNVTGVGANDDITFATRTTSEVMIMADYGNAGDVWVNLDAAGAVDTGWRLDAGDWIKLPIGNMDRLNARIITNGDKIIVLRTV